MRAIKMLAAAALLQVAVSATAQTTLVGITNHTWKYFATTGGDPGAGWQNSVFDDSTWLSGRGLFGNDTGYPYPFVSTFAGPNGGGPNVSFYRTTFNWVGSTAGVILTMTNYVDDGSVIYINGVEVTRFNMPAGVADQTTFALGSLTEPIVRVYQLDLGPGNTNFATTPLVTGANTLAVSVHNNNATSSDTVFGLSVNGSQSVAPCFSTTAPIQPTNRIILVGRSTTFTSVEACAVPAPTFQWYRDVGLGEQLIDGATAANYTLTNAAVADSGVYYVKATNTKGTATSRQAQLTVSSDAIAPVLLSGRLANGGSDIIITADEAVCTDGLLCGTDASDTFTWIVENDSDPGRSYSLTAANVVGNVITLVLDPGNPWETDTTYTIRLLDFGGTSGVSDIYGNNTSPLVTVAVPAASSAISVKAVNGSDLYTFDGAPSALEFATFNWAGGANGTADTAAIVDAAAQALDASLITAGLASVAGTPPGANGDTRHSSDGGYIITRPTGTLGSVLLAHLRNDSGAGLDAIELTYSLGVEIPVVEEVSGHLVYYSFSGAPNTWVQLLGISGDGVAGNKAATLDFSGSPWAAGTSLYILFVDDNGSGSPDIAYEIDNFKIKIPAAGIPPSITSQPVGVSTNEGAVVRFSVVAAGSPPLSYQWFKGASAVADGGSISGATTATLTINGVIPGDAGSYTCVVSGVAPAATSSAATLTVTADLVRPVVTRAVGPNNTTIVLTFSKTLGANASQTARYTLSSGTVSAASVSNNVVTLTTSARSVGSVNLTISGVTDNRSSANLVNPNPTVVAITTVQVAEAWASAWSYNTNNLDASADWKTTGGAGWETGNALFGTETSAGVVAIMPTPIATAIAPTTVSADLITAYFRKTITLPALLAGQSYVLNHIIDDGAIFYIDGVEIGRLNMAAGAATYTTKATTAGEAVLLSLPFTATSGSHILAAEVHQGGATTSSDILFGAQVAVVSTTTPSLSISQNSTNALVTWTADSSWSLYGSTNAAGPYAPVAGNPFHSLSTPKATPATQFYKLNYVPQP